MPSLRQPILQAIVRPVLAHGPSWIMNGKAGVVAATRVPSVDPGILPKPVSYTVPPWRPSGR